jgi:hypothetical protein
MTERQEVERNLTFGLVWRDDAYATAMLCVVNAHQSLAAWCNALSCGKKCPPPRGIEMLQTGAFVPIHASSKKKHAYSRPMLSALIPLVYVPKPPGVGGGGELEMHSFYAQLWGEYDQQQRTVELINQYGSKDLVRVALGTRNNSLGERFRQKRLHDEFPLSRDATSDAASTSCRSFRPATRTENRCL